MTQTLRARYAVQVQPYSARRLGPPLRPHAMELRRNLRARSAMVHCFVKEQRTAPFQRWMVC